MRLWIFSLKFCSLLVGCTTEKVRISTRRILASVRRFFTNFCFKKESSSVREVRSAFQRNFQKHSEKTRRKLPKFSGPISMIQTSISSGTRQAIVRWSTALPGLERSCPGEDARPWEPVRRTGPCRGSSPPLERDDWPVFALEKKGRPSGSGSLIA